MTPAPRRPLRVVMVHYSDFHLDSRIQRQARALAERGDEVDLICLSEPQRLRVGDGEIRIHQVPQEKPAGGAGSYVGGYSTFFGRALRRVSRLGLGGHIDVVEAHNMPDFLVFAAVAPRLRRSAVILNVHDTFPELFATKFGYQANHPTIRLIELEERLSAAFADHVITVTQEALERLASRGVNRRRMSVVMNSPDERVFGAPRAPLTIPHDGPVRVLYHGGLAPRFGVETALRAVAASEPRLSLRVCGTGEDRVRLAALAAGLAPDRLDVAAEPVPFERIPGELGAAHIGVVPTLHDRFTELLLPVKLLEYVHVGLPAVVSRLPGMQRYFGDDDVWFFEPGDPVSLQRALANACASPAEAAGRAARASSRLREIGWDRQRERYLALVDELAASRRIGAARKLRAPSAVPSPAST
jgi:glycosyltransferase involved in cell wall biosynthesis